MPCPYVRKPIKKALIWSTISSIANVTIYLRSSFPKRRRAIFNTILTIRLYDYRIQAGSFRGIGVPGIAQYSGLN